MNKDYAEALLMLLFNNHVPLARWGNGQAKTFKHFITELDTGDCEFQLRDNKIVRKIRVLLIAVYYKDPETEKLFHLMETIQVFKIDGRKRIRNSGYSVGEKLKSGKIADNTSVTNALKEELGVSGEVLRLKKTDKYVTQGNSKSYPGLETVSENFCFTVYLTPEQFKPEGYIEEQNDKTTYFKWVEIFKERML